MTAQAREDYRRVSYEAAEAIAPTWVSRREFVEESAGPVREWLLRALAPQPGQVLLELAAGVADTGLEAAARIGDSGRLICTDFSPTMVEAARRRGAERGARNVEYRVMDAERIELEDSAVHGVLCRFGFMLMADPGAALAETRRVLRPGGRLAFAVWGPPEANPFFTTTAMALVAGGHMPPPEPGAPGIFSLASEERTRTLVAQAGFGSVRIEPVPVRFRFPDVREYLSVIADTAGQVALVLRGLPDADRAALEAPVSAALAPFSRADGYEVPGVALAAVAS